MKRTLTAIAFLSFSTIGCCIVWGWWADSRSHIQVRRVLFYQDSMHPWIKADKPGKCTICGMALTPIYEGQQSLGGDSVTALSSNNVTVLNVQTEPARRQSLRRTLRVAGVFEPNETRKTIISAPASGRIEETAIDYIGVEVREGQRLLTFYSPELTQQKYRYLVRAQRSSLQRDPTGGLAMQKGDADPYFNDLVAPLGGTVIERNVAKGQYVAEGERLFTIADASVLWFRFDVYERQLPWLRMGQKVFVSLPAIPGKTFEAVVTFIDPLVDNTTRSVKVRADINNSVSEQNGVKERLFKFGMYAEGVVQAEVPNVLVVPRSAILNLGDSACAYVDKGGNAYERKLVKLGRQGDELCEILSGLKEGEQVVTSGNVLLDAQAQFSQNGASREDAIDLASSATAAAQSMSADAAPAQPGQSLIAMDAGEASPHPLPDSHAKELSNKLYNASQSSSAADPGNKRTRWRSPPSESSDPVPYGGRRNMEGPMFVRMAELRNAELSDARAAKTAASGKLTAAQCQNLETLLMAAGGVSRALAADDIKAYNESMAKLPSMMTQVRKELGATARWMALLQPVAEHISPQTPPKTLADARKAFLPFTTALVNLVKELKQDNLAFEKVKIYHCPMAPKPGLWMQMNGPLANPFYGSEMLTCGEEVNFEMALVAGDKK